MKGHHLLLTFTLLMLSSFAFAEEPVQHPESLQEALASTYTIRYQDKTGNYAGLGSGWLVDASAYGLHGCYVVTNDHVITKMTRDNKREIARIHVVQYKEAMGNRWAESQIAEVLYRDAPPSDIAILKIKTCDGLKPFDLQVEPAEQGSPVYALGTPMGFSQTVTNGIVSYSSRLVQGNKIYLQTNAEINPGNSGGPLVDANTFRVVGMNTFIVGRSMGVSQSGAVSDGLGFSVRSASVDQAFVNLTQLGKPSHPVFGFKSSAAPSEILGSMGYPSVLLAQGCRGMAVTDVVSGLPSFEAGLKEDDVIVRMNGTCVNSHQDVFHYIGTTNSSESIKFEVWRAGVSNLLTFNVQPKETYVPVETERSSYTEDQTRYDGLLGFVVKQTNEYPTDKPVITQVYAYSEAFWQNLLLAYVRPTAGFMLPPPGATYEPKLQNVLENQGAFITPAGGGRMQSFQELEEVLDSSGRQLNGTITQASVERFALTAMQNGHKLVLKVRFVVLKSPNYRGDDWNEDPELTTTRIIVVEPKPYTPL